MLKGSSLETGYYDFLERYLVPVLRFFKLRPNHVSFLGLVTSILTGILFAFTTLWGGLFTLLTGLLDTLDGSLARNTGQSKKSGAFLDSVLDRYSELIIYLGIWFYFYRNGGTAPFFSIAILLILFGSLMVSYTRARAEGLGVNCLVGLFQRGERIVLIGIAGVLNSLCNGLLAIPATHWARDIVLIVALLVLALGTNLTALWRFFHVLKALRQ